MTDDLDAVIDEALEGNPRAAELDEMIDALRVRLARIERDREAAEDPATRRSCDARIREVRRQIEVLSKERIVSEFVELSVRAAALRPERDRDSIDRD